MRMRYQVCFDPRISKRQLLSRFIAQQTPDGRLRAGAFMSRDVGREVPKGGGDKNNDGSAQMHREAYESKEKKEKQSKKDVVQQTKEVNKINDNKLKTADQVVNDYAKSERGENIKALRTTLAGPNVEQYCKDGAQAAVDWAQSQADKGGYGKLMAGILTLTGPPGENSVKNKGGSQGSGPSTPQPKGPTIDPNNF